MKRSTLRLLCLALVLMMSLGLVTTGSAAQERKKLSVLIWNFGLDKALPYDNNYWFNYIQENFGDPNNIDVEFTSMDRWDETTMLNVWMASGEAPDIIYTYDINIVQNYLKQGGLADLTESLAKYGSHIYDYIGGEEIQKNGVVDGKQMFLLGNRPASGIVGSSIRGDWLEKLGLPVPTTTDEWLSTMVAFKEKDPGGFGDQTIPCGMGMQEISFGYFNMLYSFIDPDITPKELATIYPFQYKGYKEGVAFLNKCYNLGLISPEFALDTDCKKMYSDIVNGYVGFYSQNVGTGYGAGSYFDQMRENIPDAYYVACDPFTNAKGETPKLSNLKWDKYIMVPVFSKAVDEAIMYMDWIASDKSVMLNLMYGAEGADKAWQYDEDNLVIPNRDYMGDDRTVTGAYGQSMVFFSNLYDYDDPDLNRKAETIIYPDPQVAIQYAMAEKDSRQDPWFFPFWPVPIASEAEYSSAIISKYKEMFTQMIMCNPDAFDGLYDSLVDEFMSMYGNEVCAERLNVWETMIEPTA